jgi:phosphate-selective porin OprO/OprP
MFLAAAIFGALAAGVPVVPPGDGQSPVGAPSTVAPASQTPEPADGWAFVWDDRPSIRYGEHFRLDVRLRLQTDFQWSPLFDGDHNFFFALKRLGVRGNLGRALTYALDRELDVPQPWRDAYLNVRLSPGLEVRGGQFKLPFGLDQNTPLTSLDFVYRTRLGTLLSPGRDPGIMVHGRAGGERIEYFAGGFTHDGKTARTITDALRVQGGATLAARLLARPLAAGSSAFRTMQVGGATTLSDVPEGLPGLRGVLPIGGSFLLPETPVKGRRVRAGLEALWQPGPFSLKGEYARVTTERRDQADDGGDLSPLRASAWFVSTTWIVTGERTETGAGSPNRPLFQGGPGAVELAARVERLTFGSTAAGDVPSLGPHADRVPTTSDLVWTLGLSWYWNRWAKIQANLIHDRVTSELADPVERWSQVIRLQLVF